MPSDPRTIANKYSPERADVVIDAVGKGVPITRAAALVGVRRETIYDWTERFPEFGERLERARAELAQRALTVVVEDSLDPAQKPEVRLNAAKFILSHIFSTDFATKQVTELTGPNGGPVQVQPVVSPAEAAQLTDEQLQALEERLVRRIEAAADVVDVEEG
jgi:hypothetical protein